MVKNEMVKWFADSYVQKLFKALGIAVIVATVGFLLVSFVPLFPEYVSAVLAVFGSAAVFFISLCVSFNFFSSPEWDAIKA